LFPLLLTGSEVCASVLHPVRNRRQRPMRLIHDRFMFIL
jgi:hypothetical protein